MLYPPLTMYQCSKYCYHHFNFCHYFIIIFTPSSFIHHVTYFSESEKNRDTQFQTDRDLQRRRKSQNQQAKPKPQPHLSPSVFVGVFSVPCASIILLEKRKVVAQRKAEAFVSLCACSGCSLPCSALPQPAFVFVLRVKNF